MSGNIYEEAAECGGGFNGRGLVLNSLDLRPGLSANKPAE